MTIKDRMRKKRGTEQQTLKREEKDKKCARENKMSLREDGRKRGRQLPSCTSSKSFHRINANPLQTSVMASRNYLVLQKTHS